MPLLNNKKGTTNESIELGNKTLHAEAEQKLHGIIIDKDLNFQNHTKSQSRPQSISRSSFSPFSYSKKMRWGRG